MTSFEHIERTPSLNWKNLPVKQVRGNLMHDRYLSERPIVSLRDNKSAALFFDDLIFCYWFDHKGVFSKFSTLTSPTNPSCEFIGPTFSDPIDTFREFEEIVESGLEVRFCTARTTRKTFFPIENSFDSETECIIQHITDVSYEKGQLVLGNWDACGRYDETIDKSEVRPGYLVERREEAFLLCIGKLQEIVKSHDFYGWDYESDLKDAVEVTLANISVIDSSALSWSQIAEIRKDKEALSDLRTLRRFVLTDMQGLPLSYVEDVLHEALDAHESAAKKWGLVRLPGEITIDCEASIAAGFLTALGVAFSGGALSSAAAIGALVPLGQALVSIGRGRRKFLEKSRVGYLSKIRKMNQKN